MTKFRNLFLAAVGLLFAVAAQAQYSLQTSTTYNGTTGNFGSATTNSALTAPVLTVNKATHATVQVGFKLDGAGTSAVVFKFDESIDGSNWVPTTRTLSVTAAGTTTVHNLSNLTIGGAGYLRLSYIGNPNSANITNLYVKYASKPGI